MAICYCSGCKNAFLSSTDSDLAKCPKCGKECDILSENEIKENKDAIYLSAIHKKQIALYPRDVEEAKELFVSLGKYRDCPEQIESCEYLASRMVEREIVEESSRAFSPAKVKKALKIFAIIAAAVGIIVASLLLCISPIKYALAKKNYNGGNYEKAAELFSDIADYKDGKEYLKNIYDSFSEKEGKKVSCSALEPYFSVSADGAIIFQRSRYTGDGDIVIPAVFDGVAVHEIEKNSFKNYTKLTSVSIPETVTEISDYAFYGCSLVKEITLPDGVKHIGQYAFMGCSSLEKINIPSGVTSISSYAFASCTSLKFPDMPEGLTKIDTSAFLGCSSITGVILPQNVQEIGAFAFDSCTKLSSLTLSHETAKIGEGAFSGCISLKDVTFMGSEAQYKEIAVEKGNERLTEAKINFAAK
ncbi:MAG: leucine-rich repeat domain-containing protein [Ruminococcaceae bacterium]|nr:leucine-rich repeat domain-containing protein [Oscillospiraceae bacterium]